MPSRDARRLSLILLLTPLLLWLALLIILPHIGMGALSLRERVSPRVYTYGIGHYVAFAMEPIYWNTLMRTAVMSLLVTGLDPNPEMLQSWSQRRGMAGRSFLSQARHWIKAVIEATAPHVCAYKPSLGFYQALGPVGLDLLREVRTRVKPLLHLFGHIHEGYGW